MMKYILPLLGWSCIRFIAGTSRIVYSGEEIPARLKKDGKTFIFAFWHGRQFFLAYVQRMDAIDVLISQSKDGEYIARIIGLFGAGSIRGSSSRGGSRALIRLKHTLEKGRLVGFTPDGPRGPVRKVQRGVVFLAQKTGVPIVPLAYSAKRCKIFYGWDEYYIPYPFNYISVTYGEPLYIAKDDSIESASIELEKRLNANTEHADRLAGRI